MPVRPSLALLAALSALLVAPMVTCPGPVLLQDAVSTPGYVQPETPGAPGAPAASANVVALLGASPDLNVVTTQRFAITKPDGSAPRIVVILVPGFLGGASSFSPLARDLVRAFNGELQAWVVDRRPNQLEDRLGTAHAASGFPPVGPEFAGRLEEGTQFYFPEAPGFDVDQDGVVDPPFELEDAFGVTRSFLRLAQDDVRFMAHWGLDTYARDWKLLVEAARALVGERGLVLFGGHSMGTGWTARFAAYDFDPGPGVDASHEALDGLLLLEGGGAGAPDPAAPDLAGYQATVDALAAPGGPDVYLESFNFIDVPSLGAAAELGGVAGLNRPDEPSILQRTQFAGGPPLNLLIFAPVSNESAIGLFIDDDFSTVPAFAASVGFTSNGPNLFDYLGLGSYGAAPSSTDPVRLWQNIDDPTIPTCPPNDPMISPGCGIEGEEVEVTDMRDFLRLQGEPLNFIEWYFASGRVNLDFEYGRDSSALGDESLLAVTQNASMDLPVLAIGGSNGLTPTPASFADYLGSIATPEEEKEVVILPGYAHLDVITATRNDAVPVIVEWMSRVLGRKLASP